MSTTITLQIPEALLGQAGTVAARQQLSVDEVLTAWLRQGMKEAALDPGVESTAGGPFAPNLLADPEPVIDAWFHDQHEGLTDAESVAREEQLRAYRQRLIRSAQRITDWLALGGLSEPDTNVTHLLKVQSTMLFAVGYDVATEMLEVVFNSGGIYRYFHVPAHIHRELLAAESKGAYMWSHIFNAYPYTRLRQG